MAKIAVLGWGSLICDPRNLCIKGKWYKDGLYLPVEFARVSNDRRLTLVLYPSADKVQVFWAYMDTENLEEAIDNLKEREGTKKDRIGFVKISSGEHNCRVIPALVSDIKQWAEEKHIDAVIWTELPSNFEKETKTTFTEENVIDYLRNLKCDKKRKARKYIRKAPFQIKTKLRKVIEERLGWTYSE